MTALFEQADSYPTKLWARTICLFANNAPYIVNIVNVSNTLGSKYFRGYKLRKKTKTILEWLRADPGLNWKSLMEKKDGFISVYKHADLLEKMGWRLSSGPLEYSEILRLDIIITFCAVWRQNPNVSRIVLQYSRVRDLWCAYMSALDEVWRPLGHIRASLKSSIS